MSVRINPSILSADFVNMERDLQLIANADLVHVDVMDNHFVPNLTFGPQMVKRIQDVSPIPLDVHLMIEDPDRWAVGYAEIGAASVTFHFEATGNPFALAARIRDAGSRAGVAIKPGTGVEGLIGHLGDFDQILVMTVEPGFGGQKFRSEVLPKLELLSEAIRAESPADLWLQVDGGIDLETIGRAAEGGANTFVAGSSVFSGGEPAENIERLRSAARRHSIH